VIFLGVQEEESRGSFLEQGEQGKKMFANDE